MKNLFFTEQMSPSALSVYDMLIYWTEKTFLTADGYFFQAFLAFTLFNDIKYIILQKVKNNKGYLDLSESTAANITQQT
jgi:hypothetical protein